MASRRSSSELRRCAEERLALRGEQLEPSFADEIRVRHELEVHQIELELQNEELRRAHLETQAALERFSSLFELAPVSYLVLDVEGRIVEANLETVILLGVARKELVGTPFKRFFRPDDSQSLLGFVARVLTMSEDEVPGSEICEVIRVRPGESDLDIQLHGAPHAGNARWVLVAMHDVTTTKHAERVLREAAVRKDEFLAILSHELRNPLAPIRNSLSILQQLPQGEEDAIDAMAIIDRQLDHLVHIVDDLLDVTRIARGTVTLRLELLELGQIVAQTVDDHRQEFEKKGIAVAVHPAPEPLWVDADATRLVQVLTNLLVNAFKFTARGGHVDARLHRDGPHAVLLVQDDGIGIAHGKLEKVFEPFVQDAQSLNRARGGLGLGLAMVRGIVELHGGQVSATSSGLGRGATFKLLLPSPLRLPTGPRHPSRGSIGKGVASSSSRITWTWRRRCRNFSPWTETRCVLPKMAVRVSR